jgi:hypothetical protein
MKETGMADVISGNGRTVLDCTCDEDAVVQWLTDSDEPDELVAYGSLLWPPGAHKQKLFAPGTNHVFSGCSASWGF